MTSGKQKRPFGPYSEKSVWVEPTKTWQNFPLGIEILIWHFKVTAEVKSKTSNIKLKVGIYREDGLHSLTVNPGIKCGFYVVYSFVCISPVYCFQVIFF